MLTRSSKHILKYQTAKKQEFLVSLFSVFKQDLQLCIDQLCSGKISLSKFDSFEGGQITHSAWKQIIYKNASEIIRTQCNKARNKRYKAYQSMYYKCSKNGKHTAFTSKRFSELKLKPVHLTKYFTKPDLKNISMTIDSRVLDIQKVHGEFNEFVQVNLPWFQEGKRRALKLRLPIKQHRHSRRFTGWNRQKSIRLRLENGKYFIDFIYTKEEPVKRSSGEFLGLDQGYNKLLSDSNGKHYGQELKELYLKISKKVQSSKNFKQLLHFRDTEINRVINDFFKQNSSIKTLFIENLKEVKKNSKIFHTVMNKVQRWCYSQVISKLENLCAENGVTLIKVNPAYTSQTCSNCGAVDKESRSGEWFSCLHCGMEMDADSNAAINILGRGVYSLSGSRKSRSKR